MPAELRRYERFVNDYCWTRGTYYAVQTYDERVFSFRPSEDTLVYYYQWVTVFLMAQAALFYAPRLVWHTFVSKLLDVELVSLIGAAKRLEFAPVSGGADPPTLRKYVCSHFLLKYLNRSSPNFMRRLRRAARMPESERNFTNLNLFSSYTNLTYLTHRLSKCRMCLAYVLVKFLYLFITIFQIYITDVFLR